MKLLHSGKVRDVYLDDSDDRGDLVLVASDRVSIYDVVLPTAIPDKGAVLTRLSLWWFDRLGDLVPNHVISGTDVPPEFAGRAMRCRRLEMLPVECVARGYLTGSGLKDYEKTGTVSGVGLPPGLVDGSELPEPIFTPSTKAPLGQHDEAITFADVEDLVGGETAARLRELTLAVYARGAETAAANGILVADTKLEFGRDPATGEIVLADEVLDLREGHGLVVLTERRLRRRREDRLGQQRTVDEPGRQRHPGHRAGPLVVLETGSGQVAAGDALDRQHLQPPAAHRPPGELRRDVVA